MALLSETQRPLPSFDKWLQEHAPGTLAPDFEEFADLMRRTQQQSFDALEPHEASFLRMWQGYPAFTPINQGKAGPSRGESGRGDRIQTHIEAQGTREV